MKKIALIIAVILFLLMFFTVRMEAQDTASKEAVTQAALDYMDGQWKIINVLWVMNPAVKR